LYTHSDTDFGFEVDQFPSESLSQRRDGVFGRRVHEDSERCSVTTNAAQVDKVFVCLFVCEAIGTAASPGLLCQPRVIVKMIVEKQMGCRLAGKPKFSEKPCPSAIFVHHKIPHDQTRV
jgi:hypothetical protein